MTVARKPRTRSRTRKAAPGAGGGSQLRAGRTRYWSAQVTERSDALDLDPDVFSQRSPHAIAVSLKRSAERSRRRKSSPYRSAMSMLTFYINRAGRNLPASRKRTLERAKGELRVLFGNGGRERRRRDHGVHR
jgi:hypothetical protein